MNHKFRPIALLFAVLTAFASLNVDAATIEFRPVGGIGNNIAVLPGTQVTLEVFVSGYAPILLSAYQVELQSAGFSNGVGADLLPFIPACTNTLECEVALGVGSTCDNFFHPPGCSAGFINGARTDYLFASVGNILNSYGNEDPDYRWGSNAVPVVGVPDPGGLIYLATLVLDIPIAATGLYTLGFDAFAETVLVDDNSEPLAGVTLVPATINVVTCLPSRAPEIEVLPVNGIPTEINKARNLAFSIPDSGERAVQVTFDNLPSPFDIANGTAMWVAEPSEECENSGQGFGTPIDQCGTSGRLPNPTYKVARLQCAPLYRDWSGDGVINVYDELVVPNGTYSISVVHVSCPRFAPDSFSEPLAITTAIWGDLVLDCTGTVGTLCSPPEGEVNISTDVTTTLQKFQNTMAIGKARADMEPTLIDGQINISDVTFVLGAFSGDQYPFADPELCPPVAKSGSPE